VIDPGTAAVFPTGAFSPVSHGRKESGAIAIGLGRHARIASRIEHSVLASSSASTETWSDRLGTIKTIVTVENNVVTSAPGGVTRKGFTPGRSGNPGGRPKGLARRVRELVGADGERIAVFFFEVMTDPKQRLADRMEAARWLADRAFGKAVTGSERLQVVSPPPLPVVRTRSPERLGQLLQIADDLGWKAEGQ
jgi:hypothetical protein